MTIWLTISSMMIVFGAALFVLLIATGHTSVLKHGGALRLLLTVAGWVLVLLGTLAFSAFASLGGIPLWLIGLVLLAMSATQYRACQRDMLLWALATAAQRGLPLSSAASSLAAQHAGAMGTMSRDLAGALEGGASLTAALGQAGQLSSDEVEVLVRIGDQFDAAAPALRQAALSHGIQRPLWQSLAGTFFYLFFVFSILSSTTIFMMWKIVPAMDKIFDDFGAQLPAVTQMLMAASDFIVNYGFIFVYWPLSVIYLIGFYVLLRYVGWVRFGLPGLQWLGLPLHRATILSCLAIVVEQGKPLVEALIALKDCYPRYFVRRRLERTAGSVQRGEHWQVAMRRYGLLTTADAAILQAAERVGNLPWAMREMGDRALRRYYYRMQAATQMLALLLLLALGLLGCFIAMGMFAPLAKLINSLA